MEFLGFTVDVASLTNNAIGIAVNLLIALLIFVVGRWLAKRAVSLIEKLMTKSHLDSMVTNFLTKLLYGILLVIVILAALNRVGVQTTSVVAILGGAALAVGMALKDQLSNFAAGVMIITFRPFVRGHVVQISDYTGTVEDITLVSTHITTINNHDIIIPNSDISRSAIINYTTLPNRRVDITLGVGYGADIKTAKTLMLETAQAHPFTHSDPAPVVNVTNLGDNSVDLTLNVWTDNANWWKLQCDLLEQFKYAMDEHDIDIPYPQRSLHLEGLDKLVESVRVG